MVFFDADIESLALATLDPNAQLPVRAEEEDQPMEEEEDWDDVMRTEERQEAYRKEVAEAEKKNKAAQTIIDAFRMARLKRRLSNREFRKFELEEMFGQFVITSRHCGVCGKVFTSSQDQLNEMPGRSLV